MGRQNLYITSSYIAYCIGTLRFVNCYIIIIPIPNNLI